MNYWVGKVESEVSLEDEGKGIKEREREREREVMSRGWSV
jgi:hypothetical protein